MDINIIGQGKDNTEITVRQVELIQKAENVFGVRKLNHKIFVAVLDKLKEKCPDKWTKRWQRTLTCGSYLTAGINKDTDRRTIVTSGFCKDRLCPVCIGRDQYKFQWTLCKMLNYNQSQNPEYMFELPIGVESCFYTTFSMGHVSLAKLQDTITKLRKGFKTLQTRKSYKQMLISGTITHLYIDRNPETNLWHPYLVALFELGEYKAWERIPTYERHLNKDWEDIRKKSGVSLRTRSITLSRAIDDTVGTIAAFNKPFITPRAYLTHNPEFTMTAIETLDEMFNGIRTLEYTGTFRDIHAHLLETPMEDGGLQKPEKEELLNNYEDVTRTRYVRSKGIFVPYTPPEKSA